MKPDIAKLTKLFAKLSIADLAFRQVRALSEHMIQLSPDPLELIFTPQMGGIVVTYAKNFVSSDGMGPLPNHFNTVAQPDLQETHDKLIEARHRLYAHRDLLAAKSFIYDDQSEIKAYQVQIQSFPDGSGVTLLPNVPELNPSILSHIVRLTIVQSEKVKSEFNKIIPIITKGKTYQRNKVYTVGVDFP